MQRNCGFYSIDSETSLWQQQSSTWKSPNPGRALSGSCKYPHPQIDLEMELLSTPVDLAVR